MSHEKVIEKEVVEKIAEENERKIVKFINIDKESFTHSFRGISIKVGAGNEYIGRFPECDHLATHLARKILSRAKKAIKKDEGSKGASLYTEEEVNELKEQIIKPMGSESTHDNTPEEARKEDLKRIEKKYNKSSNQVEVKKEDVIKDLKERGIEPDVNKSKEELLNQLIEDEAKEK